MKRYLNTKTLKQTTEYLDSTTVIDTDPRVANWFTKCPDGYKGEWIDGTYTFVLIPLPTQAELDAIELTRVQAQTKSSISKAIATMRIEIEYNAKLLVFDGNEPSQARMSRAIQTLESDETIDWRMFDNSTETITKTELGLALRASGIKMSELWFCVSVEEVETIVSADPLWLEKYND